MYLPLHTLLQNKTAMTDRIGLVLCTITSYRKGVLWWSSRTEWWQSMEVAILWHLLALWSAYSIKFIIKDIRVLHVFSSVRIAI